MNRKDRNNGKLCFQNLTLFSLAIAKKILTKKPVVKSLPFWMMSCQESMTRSLQLYCVRVTAFSKTDLFID